MSSTPVYNAATTLSDLTITVTNVSGQSLAGPLEVVLESTYAKFISPADSYNGVPYFAIPGGPGAGESKTLKVQYLVNSEIDYLVYSGSLQN